MPTLVQKFGGTSVSTPERRQLVVEHVRRARGEGYDVAIVVSAMGRRGDPYATDTLLDLLRSDGGPVCPADYTLMFVTGEIISVAMMSHTLNRAGIDASGLTGAQARVLTDGHPTEAEILEIDVSRLRQLLAAGEVPVITGGQGVDRHSFDFNTLGRGASDTSGVAVGAALGAERVEIFTDVDGVASADPRIVPGARTIARISFERMYELARFGAKVIHPRAVRTGWNASTPIVVRSTFSPAPGTWIGRERDQEPFSGVASLGRLWTVTVPSASMGDDALAAWERRRLIMHLSDTRAGALVLGCANNGELRNALTETELTPMADHGNCAWVSMIGDTALVARRSEECALTLSRAGIQPLFQECAPFRVTYVVDAAREADAVRTLHTVYAMAH